MSPAVRELDSAEVPVKLERVEVSPGNFIKMSPGDKKLHEERVAEEKRSRDAWLATGRSLPDEEPAAPAEAGVPLTVLTKAELVSLAEARGLATSGSKSAIAARFAAGEAEADGAEGEEGSDAASGTATA